MPVYHLGALHPVEQALTLLLAFGPFVVLGIVIVLRRRADERADERADAGQPGQAEAQTEAQTEPEPEAQRER
jgi:cytochrome c-type biogenesis protein CcmH/NrfF